MRFHVLGICHTISNKEYLSCAFTQKVVKFCEMMKCNNQEDAERKKNMTDEELIKHPTIHHLIHYGHEKSQTEADEHVSVINDEILFQAYGHYNWKKEFFKHKAYDVAHMTFSENCKNELGKRVKHGDIILCFWGFGHQLAAEPYKHIGILVEPGIGYNPESSFTDFKVFESYACMHKYYGYKKIEHPPWYDCVIPNYFNEHDFIIQPTNEITCNEELNGELNGESQLDIFNEYGYKNYYLYIGRIIKEKGLDVIIHLAKTKGFRLLIAGQGDLNDIGHNTKTLPRNIQYVGYADVHKRKILMTGAKALFLPTMYIEPFGGVVVESMFCGTPVITCDWGVFNETVLHGVTGYRCRTLDHFEFAINNVDKLDSQVIKEWATKNYGFDKIRKMYEEYFGMLLDVKFKNGFMVQDKNERTELNWLSREYPTTIRENINTNSNTYKEKQKEKILIITETNHAFGTICSALQKYSNKYHIDMIDWSKGLPNENKLIQYDKIYLTVIDVCILFLRKYKHIIEKYNIQIYYSIHGHIDIIKHDFDTLNMITTFTKEDVDNFVINDKFLNFIKNEGKNISVVSKRLKNIFENKYNMNIHLTECGFDKYIFYPERNETGNENEKLRVINLFPKEYHKNKEINYKPKRLELIKKIEIFVKYNNMDFIYPKQLSTSDEMREFYNCGDVFICLSHSEGNPLGAFEAGGCGLTGISTKVGAMTNFIQDNETGYLIENIDDDYIYNQVCEKLIYLRDNRQELQRMKNNMYKNALENWTWESKIEQWDNFFSNCYPINEHYSQIDSQIDNQIDIDNRDNNQETVFIDIQELDTDTEQDTESDTTTIEL